LVVVLAVDAYWRSLDDSPRMRVEKGAEVVSAFRDYENYYHSAAYETDQARFCRPGPVMGIACLP
jgi:hypothetical protein